MLCYNNMPDIVTPLVRARSPVRTRLRPTTLARSVRARQRVDLRRRRRALEKEIRELETALRARTQQQTGLIPQVTLANSHMLDDIHRSGRLARLIRDTSRRSQMEELIQTDVGQRNDEVERQLHEYERNRPYDSEAINRLRAEMYSLNDAMFANTQALLAPLEEERALAQANHDIGYNRHLNLDQELFNTSLLIGNLTQERDDLLRQSNDLNRELGRGRTKRHKKGKRGKHTRKRRL